MISNIPYIEKKLAIYVVENPLQNLVEYFKINSYPQMLLIKHEKSSKAKYTIKILCCQFLNLIN
jgi:hypothetical protein